MITSKAVKSFEAAITGKNSSKPLVLPRASNQTNAYHDTSFTALITIKNYETRQLEGKSLADKKIVSLKCKKINTRHLK